MPIRPPSLAAVYLIYGTTDISYWQSQVGKAGFAKEISEALFKGEVAQTGYLRHMKEDEIQQARKSDSSLTS